MLKLLILYLLLSSIAIKAQEVFFDEDEKGLSLIGAYSKLNQSNSKGIGLLYTLVGNYNIGLSISRIELHNKNDKYSEDFNINNFNLYFI